MTVLSAPPLSTDNAQPATHWWVVCLCAGWCGTCREYRALFDTLAAAAAPHERWLWVDIEDDEDLTGDLDVETFPTLLIGEGSNARFLGPLLPQAAVLVRLLESLRASAGRADTDPQAQALLHRIQQAHA
ncbi:MAG: thioredoxin family protein [Burkholderiaceae bacterium]